MCTQLDLIQGRVDEIYRLLTASLVPPQLPLTLFKQKQMKQGKGRSVKRRMIMSSVSEIENDNGTTNSHEDLIDEVDPSCESKFLLRQIYFDKSWA
jgi:hypothetical protein